MSLSSNMEAVVAMAMIHAGVAAEADPAMVEMAIAVVIVAASPKMRSSLSKEFLRRRQ